MQEQQERKSQDHESDPARSDAVGHDWADEGGATADGPATSVQAAHSTDAADSAADSAAAGADGDENADDENAE